MKKNDFESDKLKAKNDKIIEQLKLLKKIASNNDEEEKQSSFMSRKNSYNLNSNS